MAKQKIDNPTLFLLFCVYSLVFLWQAACTSPPSASDIEVVITADVNRDGRVDFKTDEEGKEAWTYDRGAIFFNNSDSDQNAGKPDHVDQIVNGAEDLNDLAVLKVKKIPRLPADFKINISVDSASQTRVRLFMKSGNHEFHNLDLGSGGDIATSLLSQNHLELRLEANSFADTDWNGETDVTVTAMSPDGEMQSDTVRLRVAPFILLSNLNRGKTLYVREFPKRNEALLKSLAELVPQAGAELMIIPGGEPYRPYHIWLQDCLEIGYSEMPGQKINVVLKANRDKSLDNFAEDRLLGPDFGWIQVGSFRETYGKGRGGNGWLDWYGNLEVTPPLPGYPFGRIYYGYNPDGPAEASLNPEIVAMLDAQRLQAPPLRLDTGWLLIKHVDEILAFVPSGAPERPYKVLVVDTGIMIALLEKWIADGHGKVPMLDLYEKNMSVASIYTDQELMQHNRDLQKQRIEPNIDLLKQELGLQESDFIRVPVLFDKYGLALVPNMVNSAVLNEHIYIVAPNGPVIEGKDLLEAEMHRLLNGLPVEPYFLDARLYHRGGGEIHCGTNIRRDGFPQPWWNMR